ncbi:hypothetical protein ElyMa_003270200 [Elysia marginata]|uniref:Transmembrane protein n=1 Tax=Elysia marginata TaxID=1093978 RepID=A0AAV4JAM2_9GAST|nr:hypothetical protein ElyMa_003270200 [Elysia marginata]
MQYLSNGLYCRYCFSFVLGRVVVVVVGVAVVVIVVVVVTVVVTVVVVVVVVATEPAKFEEASPIVIEP